MDVFVVECVGPPRDDKTAIVPDTVVITLPKYEWTSETLKSFYTVFLDRQTFFAN